MKSDPNVSYNSVVASDQENIILSISRDYSSLIGGNFNLIMPRLTQIRVTSEMSDYCYLYLGNIISDGLG